METKGQAVQGPRRYPLGRILIVAGFVAFAAILVHHRFRASIMGDVVIYPAMVFTGLLVWRERRWLYAVAAVTIAVPAVCFLDWAALTNFA